MSKPVRMTEAEWKALSKDEQKKVPWNRVPKGRIRNVYIFFGLLVVLLYTCSQLNNEPTVPTPTHPVNGPWNGEVYQVEQYLKATLNDAKSYEPVKWYQVLHNSEKGTYEVKHTYRAANAFGAKIMVTDLFVMDAEGNVIEQIRQP